MIVAVDTNVILRLLAPDDRLHDPVSREIDSFLAAGDSLVLAPQVLYEFWVVATRPTETNGMGISAQEAGARIRALRRNFFVRPDPDDLLARWMDLCSSLQIVGKQAHDARLVAWMYAQNISNLLTLNARDFRRFRDVSLIVPKLERASETVSPQVIRSKQPRAAGAVCYRRVASRASPLRLFESLYADEKYAFLYESLESKGNRGRYSFLGARPRAIWRSFGEGSELIVGDTITRDDGPPLDALRRLITPIDDAIPVAPFCGGAVGYLGYDTVRWCERIPDTKPHDGEVPQAQMLLPTEVLCFDHLEKVVHVLLFLDEGSDRRFDEIAAAVERCPADPTQQAADASARSGRDAVVPPLESNMSPEQFCAMVERAKEYIRAGDIFQVVLSQRFEFPLTCSPLELYKALRITNPSPYMYFLRLDGVEIAGSSPEVLVRSTGRKVVTRPLAGTRKRGATTNEDDRLAAELLADPKERAEHVMLVDLGRNDLGRVCEFGSVRLTDVMDIERHSRVMHMVSSVEGWRQRDLDAIDVYRAVFPAGTVSGAPKVRAMEIIEELEPTRRGIYAGAIGYFSNLGDLDLCIAIRTIVMHGGKGYIQAGAGIVADSEPMREYEETLNKANALMRAVGLAARE